MVTGEPHLETTPWMRYNQNNLHSSVNCVLPFPVSIWTALASQTNPPFSLCSDSRAQLCSVCVKSPYMPGFTMQHCPQWQTMVELEIMHRIHNSLTMISAQCTQVTAQCTMQVAQHSTVQDWMVNRNCIQCSQIISQTLVKKWQIWSTLVWIEYSQLQWVWSGPHAAFSEKDANGPLGQPTPRISFNPKHFLDNFKLNDKIHLNTVTIDWIQASSL